MKLLKAASFGLISIYGAVACYQKAPKLEDSTGRTPLCESTEVLKNGTCVSSNRDRGQYRGQYRVIPNLPQCTEEPGDMRSEDGKTKIDSKDSEKLIFLRCIFLGGDLNTCVAHNDCQVILTAANCEQELDKLQKAYPDTPQDYSCVYVKPEP